MIIKLVVGEFTLNIISAYAPHAGLDEEVKRRFWERLDEIVCQVPLAEKLFIGGDFNGHIGSTTGGYGEVHGGFGFWERNRGGTSLLDIAKAFGLVIANSSFSKREGHLVTFQNLVTKTQIDYRILRRCDIGLYKYCKVILGAVNFSASVVTGKAPSRPLLRLVARLCKLAPMAGQVQPDTFPNYWYQSTNSVILVEKYGTGAGTIHKNSVTLLIIVTI
uniref:Craniofacial development protein 2-like n=1 Tax=Nicotiana tabacum TaxID=4097 RepID=A0A1S3Y4X5_TOBAC|nr:PREDICTED: craniofacial development protein 2-like [Nicotiana tabacum]